MLTYIRHHLAILVQSEKQEVLKVQQTGYGLTEAEFEDVKQDPIPTPPELEPTCTGHLHNLEEGTWFEETHQEIGRRSRNQSSPYHFIPRSKCRNPGLGPGSKFCPR
jgi:hypothetical protein